MQQAICEHEGSAGVWAWANLVSPQCVMVHLPCQDVEHLAILYAKNRQLLALVRPTEYAQGECRS